MTSVQQIRQQIVSALEETAIFDSVLTPPDDRQDSTIMKEPAAAVFFKGFSKADDNGVSILRANFSVQMKFLKIGVSDTADEIETAVEALFSIEPVTLTQKMITQKNSRSALYEAEMTFAGCRQ